MSESIQTQGKTVNDAVSEALLQLGLRRDEVEIKVLEEPKSGLLGFIGGRQAKVLVRKKPERKRGRGSGRRRDEDDQAHALGKGRGDGGRRRRSNDDDKQQESRGRRGGEDRKQDDDEPRRSRRGRRGGRGRGRGGRNDENPRDDQRTAEKANAAPQEERRDDRRRKDEDGGDQRGSGRSRRGGRGRGRGRGRDRDDQANTSPAAEVNGNVRDDQQDPPRSRSRSRRSDGDGESRGRSRRSERAPEPVEVDGVNGNAMVDDATPPVSRSRRERPAAEVATPQPEEKEAQEMTPSQDNTPDTPETPNVEAAPTAAAVEKPAEDVAAKPAKKKRTGWGGGLGARLPRRENPAVKDRKPVEVLPDAPEASASSRPRDRDRDRDRDYGSERRSRGPAYVPDDVIVSGVAATKYAEPAGEPTEEGLSEALVELANGLLVRAGFPCDVTVEDGEYRRVRVASGDEDDAGMLIGRHGQTVDAVEHLVERMASNAIDDRVRMNLDINDYRDRREESLLDRVDEMVAEVKESGRAYHVEPMSARERRVIHLRVEEIDGVTTHTVIGSGGKHVVIDLEEEEQNGD